MKNIHVLPTDKPSRLSILNNGKLNFGAEFISSANTKAKHIYITSNEEIKEGDWFLPQGHINSHKLKGYNKINGDLESYNGLCYDISKCKKIILTTDQDLIKDGIQAIPDEFLEWFVKNPNCEEVEVEINSYMDKNISDSITFTDYKIIIPKEEPKQICEYCKIEITKYGCGCGTEKPKQETLEEVAERLYPEVYRQFERMLFIKGAKWQQKPEQFFNDDRVKTLEKSMEYLLKKQERSYSEEEVELIANEMVNWAIDNVGNPNPQSGKKFDEVLNKFKKNKL